MAIIIFMGLFESFDQTGVSSLLSRNHDLHMHCSEFSDGLHPVEDVVQFAARWQAEPKWVGLSDHSPSSNDQLLRYVLETRRVGEKVLRATGIKVLTGMEIEWSVKGPACPDLDLSALDYAIAGYHEKKLNTPEEALSFFRQVAGFQFTDIVAHPDWFLGAVDRQVIDWEAVFNLFAERGILCEYNLTTPMHPDILHLAIHNTGVRFTIGSDTHDFRSIGIKRVIDAWSETMAGDFELARKYLLAVLMLQNSKYAVSRYAQLFNSAVKLTELQDRVYALTLKSAASDIHLTEDENQLVIALDRVPECELDRDFNRSRLARFEGLPVDRIVSALSMDGFINVIKQGRMQRSELSG